MANETIKEVVCPRCGETQEHKIYLQIYTAKDPAVKQQILKETFFNWECPKCGYVADMTYPCLFMDIKFRYALLFMPVGNVPLPELPEQLSGYTKRIVRTPAELKEKLLIFDSGHNDVALELVKNALCTTVLSKYKVTKLKALFSREKDGEFEFALFIPDKKEPIYHVLRSEIYQESLSILDTLGFEEKEEFLQVNAKLATKLLAEYEQLE
ncbi:CpXC domain-containing protein [Scatolibacter rhodanostii]|uniref:CpXC domain-containing protein n=1 Tax=Scatolibacter rhodanostii TaxID=2014781 RepID=UPI000C089147|nr:CpXC domain-containing protein [Scatolibacter rhodanostii]